jgi:A/G-specific adenine glycosylase
VRLHRLARAVRDEHGGELPNDESALRALPGVGPYTARAILAFAFERDVAAPDVNVRRVVHRTQAGIEWPPLHSPAELDARADALVPAGRGFDFNSALMDLGATLCTARAPKCLLCPLARKCAAAPVDAARLAALAERHARPRGPQERLAFERTARFVRGRVVDRLRELEPGRTISLLDLASELAPRLAAQEAGALEDAVRSLTHEGVIESGERGLRLAQ